MRVTAAMLEAAGWWWNRPYQHGWCIMWTHKVHTGYHTFHEAARIYKQQEKK